MAGLWSRIRATGASAALRTAVSGAAPAEVPEGAGGADGRGEGEQAEDGGDAHHGAH